MATWVIHLRIAEIIAKELGNLDESDFAVGSIAPDSGRMLAFKVYEPTTAITHWSKSGKKRYSGYKTFYEEMIRACKECDYSFLLGYFVHLMTDNLWCWEAYFDIESKLVKTPQDKENLYGILKNEFTKLEYEFIKENPDFWGFKQLEKAESFPNRYFDYFDNTVIEERICGVLDYYKNLELPQIDLRFFDKEKLDEIIYRVSKMILNEIYYRRKEVNMKYIDGGVCAAKGYKASGIHCGIRKNAQKKDLALVVSEKTANAAAVYTTNLVKGAPLIVTQNHLENGKAQAVICNSGNANTCNANGIEIAEQMSDITAKELEISADDVIVASTGVIGQKLDIDPIADGIPKLAKTLDINGTAAAEAIMTTDTKIKEAACKFTVGGVECTIGGMAKGSGMIHPNMATMLVFVTTDCAISSAMLQKAISEDVKTSFNMVSVDGDTSTNDMVTVMANGFAGNPEITEDGNDFEEFKRALNAVTVSLCKMIAYDGEGATKMIECNLNGAKTDETAKAVAKSVVCSSLVKAAMFGSDANWGRVLCAIGYSGTDVDVAKVDVSFASDKGEIEVCKNGAGIDFSEEKAKEILLEDKIKINVSLNDGDFSATAWGCDLT